ncbi:MAG: hypothetical protein ACU0CO_03950 [Shimia sp.]
MGRVWNWIDGVSARIWVMAWVAVAPIWLIGGGTGQAPYMGAGSAMAMAAKLASVALLLAVALIGMRHRARRVGRTKRRARQAAAETGREALRPTQARRATHPSVPQALLRRGDRDASEYLEDFMAHAAALRRAEALAPRPH